MLLVLAPILLAGCGVGSARKSPLEMKVRDLEREKADQARQIEQCRVEAEQLKAQIKALSALPRGARENPYTLKAVKVIGLTNFYDKDEDGKREKLIVYIQPIDQDGDAVKAAGTVAIQLWDLNKPSDQALLGQWQVQPQELHKVWFNGLVSASYRVIRDAPLTPEILAVPLTVKIVFTDFLTGEIFSDQHVIKPQTN
ncbi:MAG: hypothetical protein A2Y77_02565 [Planctomycetes bacterium RBG_13_62_9]|nr:MAG: hypothetical protein A2Y77_02565 [Planctomycetes bacterium RBG_13_62_9]